MHKYPAIEALAAMPDETVIDGEVVTLDKWENSLMCIPCQNERAAFMSAVLDSTLMRSGRGEATLRVAASNSDTVCRPDGYIHCIDRCR